MKNEIEKLSFEQADALLSESVKRLEEGNMSLEESVDEYMRASELLARCYTELQQSKGKIEDVNEKIRVLMAEQEDSEDE